MTSASRRPVTTVACKRKNLSPLVLIFATLSLQSASVYAQTEPTKDEVTRPPETPSDDGKEEAKNRFSNGLKLMGEGAFGPALAEFKLSYAKVPRASVAINTGLCQKELGQPDEALETFENALREHRDMSDTQVAVVQKNIVELRPKVGTIDVVGGEPGAKILIDNRPRGEYPPVVPLRVSAGEHIVRLVKEGFEPVEARVSVAGGTAATTPPMRMLELKDAGKLKVTESAGKKVGVFIDGVKVGETPWEGSAGVGRHMVLLRGESIWGTAPVNVSVQSRKTTSLALKTEQLDAHLQITPTPAGAQIALDSIILGNGEWDGLLPSGDHQVEVRAEGFQSVSRKIRLAPGDQKAESIELVRDDDAYIWQKPSKFVLDASTGFVIIPSLGGTLSDDCSDDPCSQSLGLGAMGMMSAVYEFGSGIGLGLSGGYLPAWQKTTRRRSTFTPNGLEANLGNVDDKIRLGAWMLGATIDYQFEQFHIMESFRIRMKLGAGVAFSTVRDERVGEFRDSNGDIYTPNAVVDFATGLLAYATPELRITRAFGDYVELGFFVQGLALFPVSSQPTFQSKRHEAGAAFPSTSGTSAKTVAFLGTYAPDTLMANGFVLGVVPGFSARFAFELLKKPRSTEMGQARPANSASFW